jgi:outer membrane protein assembly factor BamB
MSLPKSSVFLLCVSVSLCLNFSVSAEDWPQWRGPRGDGTSAETEVPTKWSATENIKWKVKLPGKGHGSPAVTRERVYLNTAIEPEKKRVLMCLNRSDGATAWETVVLVSPLEKKNALNSYASSTPAVVGDRVFVTFLDVGSTPGPKDPRPNTKQKGVSLVACYWAQDGTEVWKKNVGPFSSMHGWSCSPIPYKDTIIVNCDHDGEGYVVCLKQSSGEEVWRIKRPNQTRSYTNPTIFDVGGEKHMVMSGSSCTTSYNPDKGEQRWKIDGPTEQFAASMVYADGVFCVTGGYPQYHTLGISPSGETLWHLKGNASAAYVPSPVAHDKWFFLVTDDTKPRSRGVCLEAKTGKVMWSQELGPHHRPSAVLAGGNVYWLSDEGTCYVVKASGETFELVAENKLGEPCNATPAISEGEIFIRTDARLWCIRK